MKSISPGSGNLFAVAVNPITNKIYVADDGNGRVIVIDGSSNTEMTTISGWEARLSPATDPLPLAVNPATNMIYTVDDQTSAVSVINGATNTKAATITVGSSPEAIAVNPATNKIYGGEPGFEQRLRDRRLDEYGVGDASAIHSRAVPSQLR